MIKLSVFLAFAICCSCTGMTRRHHARLHDRETFPVRLPESVPLPGALDEISGICFPRNISQYLFAIEDEHGLLYQLDTAGRLVNQSRFACRGDYEDISMLGDTALILRSDGTLFMVEMKEGICVGPAQEISGLVPRGEYEGLFADEKQREIWMLLKAGKGSDRQIIGYVLGFGSGGALVRERSFRVALPPGIKNYHPSALARHPVTGDWYFLSSVNQVLLVAGGNMEIKRAIPLDRNLFEQPEGIAFSYSGTLYISSEKGKKKQAGLLKWEKVID